MRTFFKDNDKIIINSMDHSESLVGQNFLSKIDETKQLSIEARNDINDDFDGFVISIQNRDIPATVPFKDISTVSIEYQPTILDEKTNTISVDLKSDYGILCKIDDTYLTKFTNYLLDIDMVEDIEVDIELGIINISINEDFPGVGYDFPENMFIYYSADNNTTYGNDKITISIPELKFHKGDVLPEDPEYPTNQNIRFHAEVVTNDGSTFEMALIPERGTLVDFREQLINKLIEDFSKVEGVSNVKYEDYKITATTSDVIDTYFHFGEGTFRIVVHEDDILYKSNTYAIHVYGTTVDDETPGQEPDHVHNWHTIEYVDETNKKVKQVCTICGAEQWINYIPEDSNKPVEGDTEEVQGNE